MWGGELITTINQDSLPSFQPLSQGAEEWGGPTALPTMVGEEGGTGDNPFVPRQQAHGVATDHLHLE